MIISVTGHLGSGKSTLNRGIAAHYAIKSYSAGDFFRELAQERGLTL